ncbi:uncharacterized protein LOC124979552 [Sciurus carolinensis]|uniref:uncharacterized protein LOC124979552 n=1 Tax=Sciurus carolinensis TaxID=30640 RepID=UPI001FB20289|nr:uncharacterized protein LOC124979552 [Sciurus carolinensis]
MSRPEEEEASAPCKAALFSWQAALQESCHEGAPSSPCPQASHVKQGLTGSPARPGHQPPCTTVPSPGHAGEARLRPAVGDLTGVTSDTARRLLFRRVARSRGSRRPGTEASEILSQNDLRSSKVLGSGILVPVTQSWLTDDALRRRLCVHPGLWGGVLDQPGGGRSHSLRAPIGGRPQRHLCRHEVPAAPAAPPTAGRTNNSRNKTGEGEIGPNIPLNLYEDEGAAAASRESQMGLSWTGDSATPPLLSPGSAPPVGPTARWPAGTDLSGVDGSERTRCPCSCQSPVVFPSWRYSLPVGIDKQK